MDKKMAANNADICISNAETHLKNAESYAAITGDKSLLDGVRKSRQSVETVRKELQRKLER